MNDTCKEVAKTLTVPVLSDRIKQIELDLSNGLSFTKSIDQLNAKYLMSIPYEHYISAFIEQYGSEAYIPQRIEYFQGKLRSDVFCRLLKIGKRHLFEDFEAIFSTRGKSKGYIKTSQKTDIHKAIAQAFYLNANPFKVSVGACFFWNNEEKEVFETFRNISDDIKEHYKCNVIRLFDKDRVTLDLLGVW